jgi:hypothetical protein
MQKQKQPLEFEKPAHDEYGHNTRYSDSSFYDEKCIYCGGTDARGDFSLNAPCPNNHKLIPERF